MNREANRTGKKLASERGKCLACVRFSEGAQYVDLGGDLPRIGRMYLCSTCVDRCRRILGYASQRDFEAQHIELEASREEVLALEKQVEDLEEQLKAATNKVFTEVLLKSKDFKTAN